MTPLPDGYRLVDVPADRRDDLLLVDAWAFPGSPTPEQAAGWPLPLTWERARGVEAADGELVAVHASYPFTRFPVPGGRTAVSGLTWVGVHPGHRRRGLLREMIDDHVARSLTRGEAVSALFAAEPAIYGRFGYGLAAMDVRLSIPRGAALRDVPGSADLQIRIERMDPDRHGPVIAALHGAVDRPGWATRQSPEQRAASLHDPEMFRDGAESERIVLVERDGTPIGYARFRRKGEWLPAGPRGVVRVRDVVAADPAAAHRLWGVLLDLDLTATVEVGNLPVDDVLLRLLVDPRAALPRLGDNLWVRLLDVPVALAARRYAAPVDVVLEVTDSLLPANARRWRLVGGPDGAVVTPTDEGGDLALDVRELGAAYLGGVSLVALAAAGQVAERTPGTLARAATAFGWPQAPVCGWVF
ncbi:MAG TPA: GNAT family N-acetyltransferase [Actinotalea sp.]|nr:GNAT family N-acetyltransferase [Actinotalea sp.]